MSEKVMLHYFNGRGKMESIRWLLTVARVEFDETYLDTREQYEELVKDGSLMFQQVPMVEIDGMKLVQTRAILNYIAEKYHLHGKDLKDRAMVNMYSEGLIDLMEMMMILPFCADPKPKLDNIYAKAKDRYLPVFEKALTGPVYLVGGKLSMADVLLLECTLMLEERFVGIMGDFPNVKSFQGRMLLTPAVAHFISPGSKRKPMPDENYAQRAAKVFNMKLPLQ
ncbi:glutathione S-transferase alpha I-like isoform 2-T2 [Pholidichthys leucotaenia]